MRYAAALKPFPGLAASAIALAGAAAAGAGDSGPVEDELREAVARSLPLIQRSSAIAVAERASCFTCHHTGLPVMTFLAARERGFAVDEDYLQAQLRFTAGILEGNRESYAAGRGPGGQAFGAGSALWTLALGGWPPDATTSAVAEYVLGHGEDRDYWAPPSIRPPAEESPFAATFVALESLRAYGGELDPGKVEARKERALAWLRETPAPSTEDKVFRLWTLAAASAGSEPARQAADELLAAGREDGGWSQLPDMESDAYATGTALVALRRAGRITPGDAVYQRGLAWLLRDQLPDGSWRVRSRASPFQAYFESGYPHGEDQFISITAACWATAALLLALPEGEGSAASR